MTRFVTSGAILLPLLALFAAPAPASTNFDDIPYLEARINQVLEQEPTGAEVEWRNDATGNSGVIRVLKTYFSGPDAPCRDYERTMRQPGGVDTVVRGTGCRDSSGHWKLKEVQETEAPSSEPPSSEPWSPVPPGENAGSTAGQGGQAGQSAAPGGGETGSQAGGQAGGQMGGQAGGQMGGQAGGQMGGQAGGQMGGQSQSQTQSQIGGGAGQTGGQTQSQSQAQTGGASQTQAMQPASILTGASQKEPVASPAAPATSKPAAPTPKESAPSPPDFELPTPSD